MCGISGIITSDKTSLTDIQKNQKIRSMIATQVLRGPDSTGTFFNEDCVLAHNRLSIIDLTELGNQPMSFNEWIIVFNGEIYNFLELKEDLLKKNIHLNGSSDTEVLLKMISVYGVDKTLKDINGIFAFCVYNKQTKEFFLARDRMGEKPLFYSIYNNDIYFASNPAAIVNAIPEKQWILNTEGLWEYFKMGGIFSDKTLFRDIVRVDSAEVILIKNNIINKKLYWTPIYQPQASEQELIKQLNKSIHQKLITDVPIVLFLSGGVDSSYVASVTKNIDSAHLDSDEITFAKKVADIVGSKFLTVKPEDFDVEKILLHYSEFSGEPTMAGFIPYVVSRAVSGKYKVAITANGADELFFGYTRTPTPGLNSEFFDKIYTKEKLSINKPSMDKNGQHRHIFRDSKSFRIPILKKEISIETLLDKEISKLDLNMPESAKYRWIELMTYVKGDLNSTLDYASMANSLEVRAPFLDYKVVELALSLNEHEHISEEYGRKHILKKYLEKNNIPKDIWKREKLGFSLNKKYLSSISQLKENALRDLEKKDLFIINKESDISGRDYEYLKSAALGFWAWKKIWIDSGRVSVEV